MRRDSNRAVVSAVKIVCIVAAIVVVFVAGVPGIAGSSGLSVSNIIRKYIENRYPWKDIEISNVRVMGQMKDIMPLKIIVEKGPIGKAVFSFMYDSGERLLVRANIRAFDWVVKSLRPFRKGHVLQEDDLYREKIDVRKIPSNAVKFMHEVVGKSLRRSVIANIAITERMIESSRVVKKGKRVVLLIDQGSLRITAAGKMKEKGYVGSSVTAINLSSKREVRGVLIDENTIKVLL